MKACAFMRVPSEPLVDSAPLVYFPDSAVTLEGRPVVVPSFSTRWKLEFMPAYRVGRLGKAVAPKFASRYIDAVTVAMRLLPLDVDASSGVDLCVGFDCALTFGRWFPFDSFSSWNLRVGDTSVDIDASGLDVAGAVSRLSRYSTLRNGDVIMPCVALSVELDTHSVSALLGGNPCLEKRVIT